MRFVFLFIFSCIVASCGTQKQASMESVDYNFRYESFTRGSRQIIEINSEKTHIESTAKRIDTVISTSKKDWKTLVTEANKIDLSALKTLKAPSEKRMFDGAATATLLVTKANKTYSSASFDHGNPPKEIADLINTITALGEAVE